MFRARSKISMSFATASPSNAVDWVAEPAWAVYALMVLGTQRTPYRENSRTHISMSVALPRAASNGPTAAYASRLTTTPGNKANPLSDNR